MSATAHERVVVLAPVGHDAVVIQQVLARNGIESEQCRSMNDLIERIDAGAGVAIVTEEALAEPGLSRLLETLATQPSWSELPILTLLSTREGPLTAVMRRLTNATRTTLLRRPIPAVTLATTTNTLLQARRRQYEVRDLLESEHAALRQAEIASQVKDEFLTSVSHELRTPLSAILLWSGLLERGTLEPELADKAVLAIKQSAQAQSRLVEDLLDLSRMLMGKLRLERRVVEISEIVEAAVGVAAAIAQAKGVALHCRIGARVEALADPDRMQQIVWNLVSNAIKFTPMGGEVIVEVERDGDELVVTVADNGIGIAPALLAHVFERFQQGARASADRESGLGVGLPIVKELVRLHGGRIVAHSEGEGRGATFTIRLPTTTREQASHHHE